MTIAEHSQPDPIEPAPAAAAEAQPASTPAVIGFDPAAPPPGQYAIVEVLGHRRYAGRVSEVTRFGATFLQIEPLLQNTLLPPVLIGGSSIYQFTACDAATAWGRRAEYAYELQGGIGAVAARIEQSDDDEDNAGFSPRFLAYAAADDLVDEFGEEP